MRQKEKHDPKLLALAGELAKHMKTESDISSLSQILTKLTVETALGAEMEDHLGYGRHERNDIDNHRNGHSRKRLIGAHGEGKVVQDSRCERFFPAAMLEMYKSDLITKLIVR